MLDDKQQQLTGQRKFSKSSTSDAA